MKSKKRWIIAVAAMLMLLSCTPKVPTDLTQVSFIPQPAHVTATGDAFEVSASTVIYYQSGQERSQFAATYLAEKLGGVSGLPVTARSTEKIPRRGIYLEVSDKDAGPGMEDDPGEESGPGTDTGLGTDTGTDTDAGQGTEGYELNIGKKLVRIKAGTEAGCFYGIQTLLQTVPVKAAAGEDLIIATGVIHDIPEYAYRGAMLDVSRHFFDLEDVKRLIDLMAAYKMNTLHLHLSDDQGWRIEIKSWPELTETGGSTEVDGGEGGFYTQEQYTEIVNYALQRHITIIPEIDMPGHTNAALASYAELNCDGQARELYTGTEVGFSTLCTDKEITYRFVDDVVGEIAALTPGPWFHIGGDESHVTDHDDYVYFVDRVLDIVTKHGKKVIGWDEIASAGLAEGATVQFWADIENTLTGVEKGAAVIMSPAARAYMDMQYDSTTCLGLHWAGYIEVDHAYTWDPASLVEGVTKEDILGVEAPLWTETITTMDELEYMVLPRLPGYAEIGWTDPELRDWETYRLRLADHGERFEDLEINFYRSPVVPWDE